MRLPRALLVHTITVEPYLGASGQGPAYGPPVEVPAYVEDRQRLVRGRDGLTVAASTVVRCQLDAPLAGVEDRITYRGVVRTALTFARFDGGRRTPNHLEVTLQ